MNLVDAIEKVKGVVDTAGLIPSTSHVLIADEALSATNGRVAITLALDPSPQRPRLHVAAPYAPLRAALLACRQAGWELPSMTVVNDHLVISAAGINARLPTIPSESFLRLGFDRDDMKRDAIMLPRKEAQVGLAATLKALVGFVADDATRPWSNAILHRKGYLYATNNTTAVRMPAPFVMPYEFKLPADGALEVMRMGDPSGILRNDAGVAFTYRNTKHKRVDCEIYSLQHAGEWPNVERLFEEFDFRINAKTKRKYEVPDALRDAVATVASIDDSLTRSVTIEPARGALIIRSGQETDGGAYVEVKTKTNLKLDHAGRYGIKVLQAVLDVASHVNFNHYPEPCPFIDEHGLEGVFVGLR